MKGDSSSKLLASLLLGLGMLSAISCSTKDDERKQSVNPSEANAERYSSSTSEVTPMLAGGATVANLTAAQSSELAYAAYLPLAGRMHSPYGQVLETEITLTAMKPSTQGVVEFVDTDGKVVSVPFNISDRGDSAIVRAPDDQEYSARIAASEPVVGIAETLTPADHRRAAPETNYTAAATEFKTDLSGNISHKKYIPLLLKEKVSLTGLTNSIIVIQNASRTDNMVKLTFPTLNQSRQYSLRPQAFVMVNLHQDALIPDDWFGSAVLEGSSGVNATIMQFNGEPNGAVQSYDATDESVPSWHVAFLTSQLQNGLNTVISVMNTSTLGFANGEISLNCQAAGNPSDQFTLTNTEPVPPHHSYHFNAATDQRFPKDWYGSCTIQNAPQRNISVFVQMRFTTGDQQHASAYNAIPVLTNDGASPYYLAIVPKISRKTSWDPGTYASAVTIKNLGKVGAKVVYKYFGASGFDDVGIAGDIPAGGTAVHNHRIAASVENAVDKIPEGWQGSLFVWSDQPIGVMTQLQYKSAGADSYMALLAPVYATDSMDGDILGEPGNSNDPFAEIEGLSIGDCVLSAMEIEAIKLIFQNPEQRRKQMTCRATLQNEASRKAQDMADRHYLAHTDPDGYGPNYFVRKAGYPLPDYYGKADNSNNIESLGGGHSSAQRIHDGWLNSAAHKLHVFGTDAFFEKQYEFGIAHHKKDDSPMVNYWVLFTAYPE